MNARQFIRERRERFSAKMFFLVAAFVLVVSIFFMIFFVTNRGSALKDNLLKEGELLAGLLAHGARVGVFAENEDLLRDPVEGILTRENVIAVAVFNDEGRVILRKEGSGREVTPVSDQERSAIFERLRFSRKSLVLEKEDFIAVWGPVISAKAFSPEESLYLSGDVLGEADKMIGAVMIAVDKRPLKKSTSMLLIQSAFIVSIFLCLALVITFVLVKKAVHPLEDLTTNVKALGMGGTVEKIPVQTMDEIGKLADAFNAMIDSLREKEAQQKRLEEQLRQSQKMEAIGTLSGGIAHDFNNILTAIIGFGNLAMMQLKKNDTVAPYIGYILSSAEKAASLTQSLLAFSRKQIINPVPVDLNGIIRGLEKLLLRLIGEDIEFRVHLAGEELMVMADRGQMDQVLMNLVTNARDVMPNGGVLSLSTEAVTLGKDFFGGFGHEKPGRYAVLSVSDTGSGMDEETKKKIFDPFFTTKEVGKGTGLGLSMAYGIVKQHDGYVMVDTEPAKGTCFRIYLPLIEEKPLVKETKRKAVPTRGTETVLVAEDDGNVRRIIREVLEMFGYAVVEAADGEEAVRLFAESKRKIDILLFDIIMPRKNGKEAYDEIRVMAPGIKALFISGYTADVLSRKGVQEEGTMFIYKPVSPDELLTKIREVLDGS